MRSECGDRKLSSEETARNALIPGLTGADRLPPEMSALSFDDKSGHVLAFPHSVISIARHR
jgi:hypothetical protein